VLGKVQNNEQKGVRLRLKLHWFEKEFKKYTVLL